MGASHLDKSGRPCMVDVTDKRLTTRISTAVGKIYLKPGTLIRIQERGIAKGDVFSVAQVAGIMAAKRVPDLIPMCHPLFLSDVKIKFAEDSNANHGNLCNITITATAKAVSKTGVEMEALTAVCGAALTIYDMCKSLDREMSIGEIMVIYKAGGRSGTYKRSKK